MKEIDNKINQAKPGTILSESFIPKLRVALENIGSYNRAHPIQSAVGWSFALVTAVFSVLIITQRTDLLPDFVNFLLSVVGG